jgi:hypothetical protein
MYKFLIFILFAWLLVGCSSQKVSSSEENENFVDKLTERVIKCNYCVGYNGAGGACNADAGRPLSKTPGGYCHNGPGGPLYSGPGSQLSTHPGGACSTSPGGNCYSGPGSDGKNCSLACRLNKN